MLFDQLRSEEGNTRAWRGTDGCAASSSSSDARRRTGEKTIGTATGRYVGEMEEEKERGRKRKREGGREREREEGARREQYKYGTVRGGGRRKERSSSCAVCAAPLRSSFGTRCRRQAKNKYKSCATSAPRRHSDEAPWEDNFTPSIHPNRGE
jgi:hypothetical protein